MKFRVKDIFLRPPVACVAGILARVYGRSRYTLLNLPGSAVQKDDQYPAILPESTAEAAKKISIAWTEVYSVLEDTGTHTSDVGEVSALYPNQRGGYLYCGVRV